MDLRGRNFLTLKDFTADEIVYLLDLAAELKEKKKAGILHDDFRGKNVALIFEKTSTRTRAAQPLGPVTSKRNARLALSSRRFPPPSRA